MYRKLILALPAALSALVPAAAYPATLGYNLNLQVPVHCRVSHQLTNFGSPVGSNGISLGQLSEYCNAPGGYRLVIRYTPGTLEGARITAGDEHVVLNGSGRELLSQTLGPRIRERAISAEPGSDGFNTDRLELQLELI